MNRYLVSMALALLLTGGDALSGQSRARIEVQGGRFAAAVNLGHLPLHVRSPASAALGWVAADWGPIRVYAETGRPFWGRQILNERDLRYLLGRSTVRRIEHHARWMGLGKKLRGRWLRTGRRTVVLEVTARGFPVAELYDYRADGRFDRIMLVQPDAFRRRGDRYRDYRYGQRVGDWEDEWVDRDHFRDDDWDDDRYRRRDEDFRYRHDPRK